MRTDLGPSAPTQAASFKRVDCRKSPGDGDLLLCLAHLDRTLTEGEKFWFVTAESWRNPAPGRFLVNGAHVSFLCAAEEKERWEKHLAAFLDQAWKET